eukprot:1751929-Rhodomonas_salina.2
MDDFHAFDIGGEAWTELTEATSGTAPSPRRQTAMVAMDERVYLFGGGERMHAASGLATPRQRCVVDIDSLLMTAACG